MPVVVAVVVVAVVVVAGVVTVAVPDAGTDDPVMVALDGGGVVVL